MWRNHCEVSELIGKTVAKVERNGDEELRFLYPDGSGFRLFHEQDCCESVTIEDVCGDLDDLVGSPILVAEEVSSEDRPALSEHEESYTWTFYKFATIKGTVTVRWYGASNGYYSESVDFERLEKKETSNG